MYDHQTRQSWRTYRLPTDLVRTINATAAAKRVYKSELVAYLLTVALDMVLSGELEIRTLPPTGPRQIAF